MTSFATRNGKTERTERAALWATRLADGPIARDQQDEFQQWLNADPSNRRAIEEIVGTWEAVEDYAANEALMQMRGEAIASARSSANQRSTHPYRLRSWMAIAASLVLLVMAGGLWSLLRVDTYRTGVGERRVVALADGSKISLDGDTIVEVRFTSGERRLWLDQGRAKFDVAKNPLRPFSVQAGNQVVVATGTAFSVEMLRNQVHVVLFEGHVAVLDHVGGKTMPTLARGSGSQPVDRFLTPGRELVIADDTATQVRSSNLAVVTAIDPIRSLSWESGELVFDDEPLTTVVQRMNRYAAKPLRIGNAAAAQVRISGVFEAGDTDALTQGLAAGFGVRADETGSSITLVKEIADKPAG